MDSLICLMYTKQDNLNTYAIHKLWQIHHAHRKSLWAGREHVCLNYLWAICKFLAVLKEPISKQNKTKPTATYDLMYLGRQAEFTVFPAPVWTLPLQGAARQRHCPPMRGVFMKGATDCLPAVVINRQDSSTVRQFRGSENGSSHLPTPSLFCLIYGLWIPG